MTRDSIQRTRDLHNQAVGDFNNRSNWCSRNIIVSICLILFGPLLLIAIVLFLFFTGELHEIIKNPLVIFIAVAIVSIPTCLGILCCLLTICRTLCAAIKD